jgi:hypothetical protein
VATIIEVLAVGDRSFIHDPIEAVCVGKTMPDL